MVADTNFYSPRLEAQSLLPEGYLAFVLEPSPPASKDPKWFADDPARPASGHSSSQTELSVTPTSQGDITWDELCRTRFSDNADAQDFIAERWLGNWGKLPEIPVGFEAQRTNFHRLALALISEVRRLAPGGKFGLRWVKGGFGTPFFNADQQVRVTGGEIIFQQADQQTSQPITTLRAASEFLGVAPSESQREHDSPVIGDLDEDLGVSVAVNDFLGSWYGCATAALEELRANSDDADSTRIQLWPGHFDIAIELGDRTARATYGASPGDTAEIPQPYLYVSPWDPQAMQNSDFWNASSFMGAVMSYEELLQSASASSYHAVLEFYQTAFAKLNKATQ